jgi:peptide deformylase
MRVVALDLGSNEGERVYINPEIIWALSKMILPREGSVSMPGVDQ